VSPILATTNPGTVPIQGFGTLLGLERTYVDIDLDHGRDSDKIR
jgi:hypothetical protein